jgi:hypothetical protein
MPAANQIVVRWICGHQHPLRVPADALSAHVQLVCTKGDEAAIPWERLVPTQPGLSLTNLSAPRLWTRPETTRSPDEAMIDPVRMNTLVIPPKRIYNF